MHRCSISFVLSQWAMKIAHYPRARHILSWENVPIGSSSRHWLCTSLSHHSCSSQPNIYPILHLTQAWRSGIHELHPEHLHHFLCNEDARGIVALWLAMQVIESSQSSQMALATQPELLAHCQSEGQHIVKVKAALEGAGRFAPLPPSLLLLTLC